ncbi:hypothetical protein RVR_P1100 (plasmid) [Actinacidiphila reveromycinica]|uniref:DUF4326 domain-containing protein n=1 Tax=Actinacidiphila reveromycinica TaxID=659352 RepID=A0A7R6QBP0_9ACTN|nr:DUF4326 domain-containing protein [Streptomyces sp. SN-593]BBG20717.1 hypothetical protein RVR_P1100 [Streptomyces sp. SN-593]
MTPARLTCSRKRGSRKPPGARVVDYRTAYGNPFKHDGTPAGRIAAALRFHAFLQERRNPPAEWTNPFPGYPSDEQIRQQLAGRDVMCWCSPGAPCHADVLIATANPRGSTSAAGGREQRRCNGCGQEIGDLTHFETHLRTAGFPLPDVRDECPACTPAGTRGTTPQALQLGEA